MAAKSKSSDSKTSKSRASKSRTPKSTAAKPTGPGKSVTVVVADEALKQIEQLAGRLGEEGMKVERVRPITGVISGSCADCDVEALRKVAGVVSVREEDFVTELPPSDSTLQ